MMESRSGELGDEFNPINQSREAAVIGQPVANTDECWNGDGTSRMQEYVTIFDHRYFSRGMALLGSLRAYVPQAVLYTLSLSDECSDLLNRRNPDGLVIIRLGEIEDAMPELRAAKLTRSKKEYYYTLSSAVCFYLIHIRQRPIITYLDADTYFFGPPSKVLCDVGQWSVGITPHRFHPLLKGRERYGKYNVGWVTFVNDDVGRACSSWWYSKCLEWCRDKVESDRYADQKYLDNWPEIFSRVKVIEDRGVNCGPWNVGTGVLTIKDGNIYINDDRLVLFHFADLEQVSNRWFNTHLASCWVYCGGVIRENIYKTYIRHIKTIERASLDPGIGPRVLGGGPVKLVKGAVRVGLGLILRQYVRM